MNEDRKKSHSTSIDALRVLSIVLVVFLHARTGLSFDNSHFEIFANLISYDLGALAVPVFFTLSGYLSSVSSAQISRLTSFQKFKSRTLGLCVTYLFWNSLLALVALIGMHAHMHVGAFSEERIATGIRGVFGLNSQFPINYQFWFIRELILISVLFFFVDEFTQLPALLILAGVSLAAAAAIWLDARTTISIVAYAVGFIFFRVKFFPVVAKLTRLLNKPMVAFPAALVVFAVAYFFARDQNDWIFYLFMAAKCLVLIQLFNVIRFGEKSTQWLRSWAAASFFIFACHEPMLSFIKRLVVSHSNSEIAYLVSPIVALGSALLIFFLTPIFWRFKMWVVFLGSMGSKK